MVQTAGWTINRHERLGFCQPSPEPEAVEGKSLTAPRTHTGRHEGTDTSKPGF
jgi:hypothetical protein